MKATVYAKVGSIGWYPAYIELDAAVEAGPEDFELTVEQHGEKRQVGVRSVEVLKKATRIEPEPFSFGCNFTLTGTGPAEGVTITKSRISGVTVEGLDRFAAKEENGVRYRLYTPGASAARPLILFLHGGGESGTDNLAQMVATLGAIRLAERYPDMYVMAPQAPPRTGPFRLPARHSFYDSFDEPGTGWHREYLASVCDLIRGMIAAGKVDPARVYVTGLSMGGGGTLRALSVGSGLFAAAVPICPTMTPETFDILRSLTDTRLWVACSYVDHTIYRHKYIVDAILQLRDAGSKDARLTIFSPEDLAAYGIGTDPEASLEKLFSENHACWVPVYNGDFGILDWMVSQHK